VLRPAAAVAARITLAATAGALSVADAPAAQPGRPVMAQHAAPVQHAAPMFRPVPIQHAPPHAIGGSRPVGVIPTFTPPGNANVHAVNPNPYRVNPSLPFNNPGALRPNLPLNNPSALRPNFPLNHQGAHEPGLGPGAAPSFNNPNPVQPGSPVPSQAADGLRAGASQPVIGQPVIGQPLASQPLAGQLSVNRPVVRPLLKPPPGGFPQTRPVFPVVQRNDRFWPLHKDRKSLWFHGQRRVFVPVALLGVILIGDSYWYPDGYVSMEGPACTGSTAEGCQLEWRMVDFEDGGGEPQCVQYCPQAGPPPQQVAALPPPPPPLAQGGACQTTIYSEQNFGGNSAPTGDSQPILSSTGWRNEIASIVVAAGTWDFFADENFGGESLRLGPGTYPHLAPEWARHIGSFMCVEPGPPPA
jgi:hypothetical protein